MTTKEEMQEGKAKVVCICGSRHGLLKGENTPYYFCTGERYDLVEGMGVEFEFN